MQGQFIVVEGLEGAGKSTVIETIGEVLQKAGSPSCELESQVEHL